MDALTKTAFIQALAPLPADPLLGLSSLFANDPNPDKIDLGVGVYQDAGGRAPVFSAVKQAEARWSQQEPSKAYIEPRGDSLYIAAMETLLFGDNHRVLTERRVASVQTPGGSCALRIAADFIKRCNPDATIWLGDPTWVNHHPLLSRSDLTIKQYHYYNRDQHTLDFDAMLGSLQQAKPCDVVLLHGCCHNPSGTDLNLQQWQAVAELAQRRGIIPLVDIAYQGIGLGLDEDAAGLRLLAAALPELMVVASCSKNFALYRERVGTFSIISQTRQQAELCLSQVLDIIRGYYFVPPAHGGHIVSMILNNGALRKNWHAELDAVRHRIQAMRKLLVASFNEHGEGHRVAHIDRQQGMFSFIGFSRPQVDYLRREHSIYMADSSRINLSGINPHNIDKLVDAILHMLTRSKVA